MLFSIPKRSRPTARLPLPALVAVAALLLVPCLAHARTVPVDGDDELTLRINDAEAEPGGLAAVVIRTYSSRPVGTGQLCFIGGCAGVIACRNGFAAQPIVSYLEGHVVFSTAGDAQTEVEGARLDPNVIELSFLSESATVNAVDGPLAVMFLRVPTWVGPGVSVNLDLGPAETELIDAEGQTVPLEIRPGVLRIRSPQEPRALLADGDDIEPGEVADLGIETLEPFAVSSGRVVAYYDPAIAAGPPEVRFDQRLGHVSFHARVGTPGVVVVEFESPDSSLNRIPGRLMTIRLPTATEVAPGTTSPWQLDPRETYLESKGLGRPELRLVNDVIEFELD